jgi:nucleoid-associated protein YgaU
MSIEKLTISYETAEDSFGGEVKASFNPAQLGFSWSASWEQLGTAVQDKKKGKPGTMVFKGAQPQTLAVNLFFDTYAPYGSDSAGGLLDELKATAKSAAGNAFGLGSGPREPQKSVTVLTDQVMALTRLVPGLHRPPLCKLSWGNSTRFRCVLTRAARTYTLFLSDGTPVRATVDCSFMEVTGDVSEQKELESSDVAKRYVVLPGDTLMGIAAAHFGDGNRWRLIADANGIEDPRSLVPGRTLAIPKTR